MIKKETVWYDPRAEQLVMTWIDPMMIDMRMYQFSDGNVYTSARMSPQIFGWIRLGRL